MYHFEWLHATLPRTHLFFKSAVVITGVLRRLAEANIVLTGTFRNPVSGMVATGVPPSSVIYEHVEALQRSMNAGFAQIETRMAASLVSQTNLLQRLPEDVATQITNSVTINGVMPVTREILEETISRHLAVHRAEVNRALAAPAVGAPDPAPVAQAGAPDENGFRTWQHSARFGLIIPIDFTIDGFVFFVIVTVNTNPFLSYPATRTLGAHGTCGTLAPVTQASAPTSC